ncbi:MAG: Methyltransferase type 11 [Parcubacteria bacterium C7867-003]|nr:MAG: Methyltransferase type 11 [Parcubacteria bacterium C7867-003]
MKTHFEHLLDIVPDLRNRRVLDLGSGRGKFLVELAQNNVNSRGLELNRDYIQKSLFLAKENSVSIHVDQGVGEDLSYGDSSFDFINMAEVIEHVDSPDKVMKESYRVLGAGGLVYVSVPNRFGLKDQHFDLYFINWMPRFLSEMILTFLGRHKDYGGTIGFQRLSQMHYKTYRSAKRLFLKHGFKVEDIRLKKIKQRFPGPVYYMVSFVYHLLRPWYFDSFHFLLTK